MNRHASFRVAIVLLVLLLVAPAALLARYVYQKHVWATDRMAEIEPRHARLLGLIDAQPKFVEASEQTQKLLGEYLYGAETDIAQAGNNAQQQIRSLLVSAGLQVVSSQVLPAQKERHFNRIPLALRLEGDLLAVQTALLALSDVKPLAVLDGWSVQTVGSVRADAAPRLAVQFNLSVYQSLP